MTLNNSEPCRDKHTELKKFLRDVCLPELKAEYPYFDVRTLRAHLNRRGVSWTAATLNRYMVQQKAVGSVFDAGRGWYSSIAKPYQLDTAPVEKLVGELKRAFPLLDFACWSTAQLNEMLRHQIAKHVQFVYVERDAIGSVADWLRSNGYRPWANLGKKERQSFVVEENSVVILPLVTKAPHENGFAGIEKIMVDVFADMPDFSIINIPELAEGFNEIILSERIDMSSFISYAARRKVDVDPVIKGTVIH